MTRRVYEPTFQDFKVNLKRNGSPAFDATNHHDFNFTDCIEVKYFHVVPSCIFVRGRTLS